MTVLQPAEQLIYPNAHTVFMDSKPYYLHCVVGDCRFCDRIETAKNLKIIDDLVKRLFRKHA
jgi:hypothetical protein